MAFTLTKALFFLLTITLTLAFAQIDESSLDLWPNNGLSSFHNEEELAEEMDAETTSFGYSHGGRSLLWGRALHYYISYGALSANRVLCPPRSGRSYYTHNCYRASGPVHPYTRGCSAITRCRR